MSYDVDMASDNETVPLMASIASRVGRLVDLGISSLEVAIERYADPHEVECLREALRTSSQRLGEFVAENARLEDENECLRRQLRANEPPSNGNCTCGLTFRTAEDFRDHLPCR